MAVSGCAFGGLIEAPTRSGNGDIKKALYAAGDPAKAIFEQRPSKYHGLTKGGQYMSQTVEELSGDGLNIGAVYSLVDGKDTELIPRTQISYVSAKYQSQPIYIVIGAVAILYGLSQMGPSPAVALLAVCIGLAVVVAFFLTRRVGVVVASSGGRLFVEVRGRNRYELLERIYSDLEGNPRAR